MKYLAPDYVYTPQGLQSGMFVAVAEDGRIASISPRSPGSIVTDELPGVLLLPGFVNVHSHVFQRALRGRTQHPSPSQDTFWSWRQAMYKVAARLDPDSLYEIALYTYKEMVAAGYTSVGEFHYVHHQPDGTPYADPNAMSHAVLQAGLEAGIRVVLLMTAYVRGSFNQPPGAEQRRFCDRSLEAFLRRVDDLRQEGYAVGIAPHSVRAVPELWFREIASYCQQYRLPLHVHASEQVAEVEQCLAAYQCRPIELLERFGALGERTTVVHATHADPEEATLLARYGCSVCVCPTTEGDLGDGIAPYASLLAAKLPLAIGSDSNTRIDPIEELRWSEYLARLRYQRRRILISGEETMSPGSSLLRYGTHNGARALGIRAGTLTPGMDADLVAIDLRHPSMLGWDEEHMLDILFFSASAAAVKQVWVHGELAYALYRSV